MRLFDCGRDAKLSDHGGKHVILISNLLALKGNLRVFSQVIKYIFLKYHSSILLNIYVFLYILSTIKTLKFLAITKRLISRCNYLIWHVVQANVDCILESEHKCIFIKSYQKTVTTCFFGGPRN